MPAAVFGPLAWPPCSLQRERPRMAGALQVKPLRFRAPHLGAALAFRARRGEYRLGFNAYSGFSSISFADCAHAMIGMLADDTWRHKAPIVQY